MAGNLTRHCALVALIMVKLCKACLCGYLRGHRGYSAEPSGEFLWRNPGGVSERPERGGHVPAAKAERPLSVQLRDVRGDARQAARRAESVVSALLDWSPRGEAKRQINR